MPRMKNHFQKTATVELKKELGFANLLAVPKIEKVVVNAGIGRLLANASNSKEFMTEIADDLAKITGQRPISTRTRKSIASFKVRAGQPVGLKVTLRGRRMYDFLDRLVHIALPRSRDFKGIPLKAVDGDGNLTIGLSEHIIFPEVAESNLNFGFEITVVTVAKSRDEAIKLYKKLNFPLREENNG